MFISVNVTISQWPYSYDQYQIQKAPCPGLKNIYKYEKLNWTNVTECYFKYFVLSVNFFINVKLIEIKHKYNILLSFCLR